MIENRLAAVANRLGMGGVDQLVDRFRHQPTAETQQAVIDALTTNETSFFRDLHPFRKLQDEVLPKLITARRTERTLNIWSAACSTGQEAYTICMTLRENFPELVDWKLQIIGTDICETVLAKARLGRFNQTEMNRGLPINLLLKYFQQSQADWEISPELRKMVEFRPLNLVSTWPPLPTFDIVFLRNVLIYFSDDVKQQILANVHRQMAADATLFLGSAETVVGLDRLFKRLPGDSSAVFSRIE